MQDLKIFAKPSSSLETKRNETMKRHPFQVDTTKTFKINLVTVWSKHKSVGKLVIRRRKK